MSGPATGRRARGAVAQGMLAILACGLVAGGIGGCRRERERAAQRAVERARQGQRAALSALGIREQMRRLQRLTLELRRRAAGRASWTGPAGRVAALAAALDTRGASADYVRRVEALRAQSEALAGPSVRMVAAYNALVASCRACHVRHGGSAAARQLSEQAVPDSLPAAMK